MVLPVLFPCQEVMAVTAGEQDPWEKGAKIRQQECGEEKPCFSTASQAVDVTCAWHRSVLMGGHRSMSLGPGARQPWAARCSQG